jgi:hypothetical protein
MKLPACANRADRNQRIYTTSSQLPTPVLLPPPENLVGIYIMTPGNNRYRRTGH